MKCMIPGQNVKILARALHSISRVGDELFVASQYEGLTLRVVNSSQSAFAEFKFNKSFFSSYSVDTVSSNDLPMCKISMRSCLSVFKSSHSMDKTVDWCQLRLESKEVHLIFKVKFTGGSTKTYFLPVIESETIVVTYKKSNTVKIVATSKLLSGIVKNFRLNEDEITLAVTRQKATFRNHIDICTEKNKTVRTELGLLAGEFEMYSVSEPVSLTFCLKQLRAVVAFAEPLGLPVNVYFEVPGRPVVFTVNHESVYEGNFMVSTLNMVGDSQSQGSEKSDVSLSRNIKKNQRLEKPIGDDQMKSVPSCSNNVNNFVDENVDCNKLVRDRTSISNKTSRKRNRDSYEIASDFEQNSGTSCRNNENNHNNLNSGSSIYKSVESHSTIAETVFMPNSVTDVEESVPNSPHSSPKNFVHSVFVRCFNSTFQRGQLPGFSNIIAYDSDGLEDSD